MSFGGNERQLELGQTTLASALVPGMPDRIEQNAIAIRSRGKAMEQAGDALKEIDSGAWVGDAGEAFREKFSYEPGRWHDAADAFEAAAKALDDYASMLRWAQDEADEAVELWEKAEKATQDGIAAYNDAVNAANAQNQSIAAAGNTNFVQVAPFTDPGESGRKAAQEVLNNARAQLALELVRVVTTLKARADEAPEQSMWADIGDALGAAFDFVVDFGQGLWDVASGTVEFLWAISPHHLITDPENYAKTWEALGQTAVSAVKDPIGFAKQMIGWEHWQNGEPGRALGNIVGNIIGPKGAGVLGKAGRKADTDTTSRAHDGNSDRFSDAARQDRIDRYGEPRPESDWLTRERHSYDDHPGLTSSDSQTVRDLIGNAPPHGSNGKGYDEWVSEYGTGRKIPGTDLDELKYPTAENGHPNGFSSPEAKKADWIEPGQRIDRFGHSAGSYMSPQGEPWSSRALPGYTQNLPYHVYEVGDRPIPAYAGPAAPWFDQPGGGGQYFLPNGVTVDDLLQYGYIKEVTGDYS